MQQHTPLPDATYRRIHAFRAGALVVFHASCACEVAILMRKASEVDLFNPTFGKEVPAAVSHAPRDAGGRAARIMGLEFSSRGWQRGQHKRRR
jgi:hypothetical protein